MNKLNLVESIKALKEESIQARTGKLYELVCEFDNSTVMEIFDGTISPRCYVEEDIFSEAQEGNLQSIKNKIEDISDFSVNWYKDLNGSYSDLDEETLNGIIDDILEELED